MDEHSNDAGMSIFAHTYGSHDKSKAELEALVRSIDDVIMELDIEGNFLNFWYKNPDSLAIMLPDGPIKLESIFDAEKARQYKEIIKVVLLTGEPDLVEYPLETTKGLRWFHARISKIGGSTDTVVITARDITDRKAMEASLITAKETAESANRAKSTFLSNISHELRTPLNAVLGFAQLLQLDQDAPLNSSQMENVGEIIKAGSHLLTLINDILDITRTENGRLEMKLENIEIRTLMEESMKWVTPYADKYGIRMIGPDIETRNRYVFGDRTRLNQVLTNLLTNAVKFNVPGGEVRFFAMEEKGAIIFNVTDTGIGIPLGEQDKIFEPFYRISNWDKPIDGTGIGLALAKHLVERMGGFIHVESTINMGSRFWVEMPVGRPSEN